MKLPTTEEVLDEVAKIQYLYQLKREIRYDQTRINDDTESVAEHIYGMGILASYFLPLEDHKEEWNRSKIFETILWHDIDEVETGDMLGYLKTEQDIQAEREASLTLISKLPLHVAANVKELLQEYNDLTTIEARFVKAIDKIEPLFHLYNPAGKQTLLNNRTTIADSRRIKEQYIQDFSYIKHYCDVLHEIMIAEKFFVE